MNDIKLVAVDNGTQLVFDEVIGVKNLIEAAKIIDHNCGSDSLRPEYDVVARELNDNESGYHFYQVPVDVEIGEGGQPWEFIQEIGRYVGTVAVAYKL